MNIQYRAFYGPADWGWIQQRVKVRRVEDTQGIMAIDMDQGENGETIAGVIFDSFTTNSVQAHIAIDNPMVIRHGFLPLIFHHAFITCNRKIIYAVVMSDNTKSQKFVENVGFVEKYRMEDGFSDGIDLIFYEIHKESCRFLPDCFKEAVNG